MLTQNPEEQAQRLARSLGIPLDLTEWNVSRNSRPLWDGTSILVSPITSNFLHEIAHWLVATPEQRRLVNFGLGMDPDTCLVVEDPRLPDYLDLEERASVLGILLERALGMDWKRSFLEHGWHEEGKPRDFLARGRELYRLGLTICWTPVCVGKVKTVCP